VGWTDLAAPDASAHVAQLAGMPLLVGLRPMLQDLEDPEWILKPEVNDGLSAMVAQDLVFDALVRERQLPAIIELARRFPKLRIVLDHAGKPVIQGPPTPEWRKAVTMLGAMPNISVKLSGLLTEAPAGTGADALRPYVDRLLEGFGAERVLWGSDWPVLNLAGDYQGWVKMADALTGELDVKTREAIWGGNAARIYGISGRGT